MAIAARRPRTVARAADVNTALQDALLRRAVLGTRYENASEREMRQRLAQTTKHVLGLIQDAGLFTKERLGFGLVDPGRQARLQSLLKAIALALGHYVTGNVIQLRDDLKAKVALDLQELPHVVNATLRAQSPKVRLEAADDCTWRTIGGHPVCITAGHTRQHAKEAVKRAADEIGGMLPSEATPGTYYKNVELQGADGRRTKRQISLRAVAPDGTTAPVFKVTVQDVFETTLGGNSISKTHDFASVETAKRFIQHVTETLDVRTFREAAADIAPEDRDWELPLFKSVPAVQVTELLGTPLGGAFFQQSFADLGSSLLASLRNVLLWGLTTGQGVQPVARQVQGVMGGARWKAERIVRSEYIRVANQAALTTFAQNEDVLDSVQWVATLDARTCLQCGVLDGRTWENLAAAPVPVVDTHPQCRCTLVPVVKDAEDLGLPPGSRASFSGQVPATLTYDDWFDLQSEDFQRDVLGPKRFDLYRTDRASLGDFATASGVRRVREVLADFEEARQNEALREASDDACRWITKGGRRICIRGHGAHSAITVDPELAPIADQIRGTVDRLNARYGNLVKAVKVGAIAGTGGYASKDTIYLAPVFADPAAWAAHEQEWRGLRVDPSLEGTLVHEYGHVVFKAALQADPERYYREITPLVEPVEMRTTARTSPYGMENASEAEAEAFSMVHFGRSSDPGGPLDRLNLDHAREIVRVVRNILRALFKADADTPLGEASLQEFNPNHEPAGSSKGGQFASGPGGGGGSTATRPPATPTLPATKQELGFVPNDQIDKERQAWLEEQRREGIEKVGGLFEDLQGEEVSVENAGWEALGDDEKFDLEQKWIDEHIDLEAAKEEWLAETGRPEVEADLRADEDWTREAIAGALQASGIDADLRGQMLERLDRLDARDREQLFAGDLDLDQVLTRMGLDGPLPRGAGTLFRDEATRAWNRELTQRVAALEIPDSVNEAAYDAAREAFGQLDSSELDDLAGSEGGTFRIEEPDDWVLTAEEGGSRDYAHTQAIAKTLVTARAKQLWAERNADDRPPDFEEIGNEFWDAWKRNSYAPGARAMHTALVDELATNPSGRIWQPGAEGMDEDRVYARALWETTQFLLDKARTREMDLYRAVLLPGDTKSAAGAVTGDAERFTKLATVALQQNAAQSFTFDRSVANNWNGVGETPPDAERVVVRAKVPSTAIWSLPVFGKNIHSEQEVVVLGTPWKAWDAWLGKAPSATRVMIEALFLEARMPGPGRSLLTPDGQPPKPGTVVIDFADPAQTGGKHWLWHGRFSTAAQEGRLVTFNEELLLEDDDACTWRTIGGHPVCLTGGHQEHGKLADTLGIPRHEMPQIRPADQDAFLAYAVAQGVPVSGESVRVGSLKPAQESVNPKHVAQMPLSVARSKTLLVSADHYVLDGTHRYVKLLQNNPDQMVSVLRIGQAARVALATMRGFPKAFTRTLKDVGPPPGVVPLAAAMEAAEECLWRTINGHPVCIRQGHAHGESVRTQTEETGLHPKDLGKYEKALAAYGLTREQVEHEIAGRLTKADGSIDADLLAEARHWYPDANVFAHDLMGKADITLAQAVGVIAALSPQNPWERRTQYGVSGNRVDAQRVVAYYAEAAAADRLPAQLALGVKARYDATGDNADHRLGPGIMATTDAVEKAFAILQNGSMANLAEQLGTLKTASFYNNILAPGRTRSVTVDGHMAKALAFAAARNGIAMPKDGPGPKGDRPGSVLSMMDARVWGSPGHVLIADAVRRVADRLHESPDTVQAAYWLKVQPTNPFKAAKARTVSESKPDAVTERLLLPLRPGMPWGDALPDDDEPALTEAADAGDCTWRYLPGRGPVCITQGHAHAVRGTVTGTPTAVEPTAEEAVGSKPGQRFPGQCYEQAARYIMDRAMAVNPMSPRGYLDSAPAERLVHGTIGETHPIGHAWVEIGDKVFDGVHQTFYDKASYYAAMHAKAEHVYTPAEAMQWLLRSKHFGVWEGTAGLVNTPAKKSRKGKKG
jgi:SPP1 gp7 family putative phage head morphogenesis protein